MVKLNPIVDYNDLRRFENLLRSVDPDFKKILSIVSMISSRDWEISRPKSENKSYTNALINGINRFYRNTELTKISVVYIVKDEQDTIINSIDSITELADEIIIVDTGSKDATIEVIRSLNDKRIKLFSYKWCDDFSNARNFAREKATCDWVLSMDADEKISNPQQLKLLLTYLQAFDDFDDTVFNLNIIRGKENYKTGKIIRNLPNFIYKGKVHETYYSTEGAIFYANINIDILSQKRMTINKRKYYNRLLLETIEAEPANPRWCFFYIRDNLHDCTYLDLAKLSGSYLFINSNEAWVQKNFKKSYYNMKIVLLLMLKCLQEEKWNNFLLLSELIKVKLEQHSDYIFLRYAYMLIQIQNQISNISKSFLISYSEGEDDDCVFPSEYLDSLLGTFLLMDGFYEESSQVFNKLLSSKQVFPFFSDETFIKKILLKR